MVAGQAQLGAVGQHAGQGRDRRAVDEAALVMARLGPGVGKQHERAADRRVGERLDQQARVVGKDADPRALGVGKPAKQRRDAGDVGFAADDADIRIGARLGGEVLAGAETDLEPDVAHRPVEQDARIERPVARQRDREMRQKIGDEPLPTRAQRTALPAAEEATLRLVAGGPAGRRSLAQENAATSSSTKSRRSHEKPPSGSGGRPKWP